MKEDQVLDGDKVDIAQHRKGCSNAVAHGATSASAIGANALDVARGMGLPPVNPPQATSGMGPGSNHQDQGESIKIGQMGQAFLRPCSGQ